MQQRGGGDGDAAAAASLRAPLAPFRPPPPLSLPLDPKAPPPQPNNMTRMLRTACVVFDFLRPGPRSEADVRGNLGNTQDVSKGLRRLLADGLVERTGRGGRQSPFLYEISEKGRRPGHWAWEVLPAVGRSSDGGGGNGNGNGSGNAASSSAAAQAAAAAAAAQAAAIAAAAAAQAPVPPEEEDFGFVEDDDDDDDMTMRESGSGIGGGGGNGGFAAVDSSAVPQNPFPPPPPSSLSSSQQQQQLGERAPLAPPPGSSSAPLPIPPSEPYQHYWNTHPYWPSGW